MIKKALTWLGIAFLIFFVAFNPNSFVQVFGLLGHTIADIAHSGGSMATKLLFGSVGNTVTMVIGGALLIGFAIWLIVLVTVRVIEWWSDRRYRR